MGFLDGRKGKSSGFDHEKEGKIIKGGISSKKRGEKRHRGRLPSEELNQRLPLREE